MGQPGRPLKAHGAPRPARVSPRGRPQGRPPTAWTAHGDPSRRAFGHTHDRRRVVEEEAEAIRDAATRVLAGETLSSVVQAWNDRGLRTGTGGPWRVNSLSTLLLQPRLAGLDKDLHPLPAGMFPPILDRDTSARLVALHQSRRKGPRRPTRRYLLTGLLRCWRCGGNLRGVPSSHGADLYICPGPPHGGCSGTAVTADRAEDAIRDRVLGRLDADEVVAAAARPGHPSGQETGRRADTLLAEHRQRSDELADMWATGQISRAEWLALKRAADRRARQVEAATGLVSKAETLRRLAGTGSTLRRRWPEMTTEERRRVIHAVLDHVEVLPPTVPRGVFNPERLRPVWVKFQ